MKKVLAIFLSVLLVCISIAPMGMAVTAPELATRVIEGGYSESASQVASVTTNTFTIVVKAPQGIQKLVGVNLYFDFDPAVLAVAKAGLAGTVDTEGNENPFFNGMLVSGLKANTNNEYAMAWIPSGDGVSKNQARDLVYITFAVLDTTVSETSVNLYIDEFRTDDGNNENDITATLLLENRVVNFNFPEDTPPAETTEPDSESEGTSADDINGLLQLIRDMLNGNGVTFGDFADAIANVLGNAEITDIIEQLVDGNIDISEIFQEFLGGLGLDFGMFEDILNMIIEFIMGLFGGDTTPAEKTTAAADAEETTAEDSASTTANGSSSGSEKTGDMGIALAATVCVAASAAFILTRKKKETV